MGRGAHKGAKLIVLFLLLVYASSAFASDFTLYRCTSDGLTRTSCCCSSPSEAPSTDVVRSPGCCDTRHFEVEAAPAVGGKGGERLAPKVVAPVVELPSPPPALRIANPSIGFDRDLGPKAPPILRIKCALLL